jgi:GR25 family glycosyltransferase involved in LPS biosynthesis
MRSLRRLTGVGGHAFDSGKVLSYYFRTITMHAYYINLDHRTDRRAEIEKELADKGISAERIPAFKTTPGCIGCSLSHIAALKLARERGLEAVMIFEDDFTFLISKDEWDRLFSLLPASYDVVMLSYNLIQSTQHDAIFDRVQDVQTASGYIVHSRFYDRLIAQSEAATHMLSQTGMHWLYAYDQQWKMFQPNTEWFAYKTRIGKQRDGISDNGEGESRFIVNHF